VALSALPDPTSGSSRVAFSFLDPISTLLGQPQFGFRQTEVMAGDVFVVLFYDLVGLNLRELVAVPSGMWLEFGSRNLRSIEAI
jgi:hypothetical protein